ncbi:MAG: peptide ABC transporter substrate-binding protein [Proteobacteria bacterium]|nr:peptide ABC transporter substrate-binding protein [Pseudomonadota bacterium]
MGKKILMILVVIPMLFLGDLWAETQEVKYSIELNPKSMDPGLNEDGMTYSILLNMYEPLIYVNTDGTVRPAAAESWTISKDGRVYTFKIRSNAKWSDGKALTANDFEYAWKRAVKPSFGSGFSYKFNYLKNGKKIADEKADANTLGVKAIDKKTLQVTLEEPTSFILSIMALNIFYPVREDMAKAHPDKWTFDGKTTLTNGAFKLERWVQNEEVVITKNKHFWDADNIKLEKISYVIITDSSTALTAYEAGQLDGCDKVPASEVPRLLSELPEFKIQPALRTAYLEFNTTKPPFNDINVRKAFSYAIDRRAITRKVTRAGEKPATGIVPFGIKLGGRDFRKAGGTYGIDPRKARVKEAREYLAKAGYPGGKGFPAIKLHVFSANDVVQIGEVLMEMWKKNLQLKDIGLLPQEENVHYDQLIAGDYQVGYASWGGDYYHPLTFLDMWIKGSGFNETGYYDTKYDAMIAKAKTTLDVQKSMEILHKAEDRWMSFHAIAPLFYSGITVLEKPYLKNVITTVLDERFFHRAYIEGR